MLYIQRNGNVYLETVDEFKTLKEALKMLKSYRMCDKFACYYISSRACVDWRDR